MKSTDKFIKRKYKAYLAKTKKNEESPNFF